MKTVKDSMLRTLSALGFQIIGTRSFGLVKILEAEDQNQERFLLISSTLIGPSWPTMASWFQDAEIEFKILEAGKTFLVLPDSELTNECLVDLKRNLKTAKARKVFIPDQGFIETLKRKKIDTRSLFLPTLSLIVTLLTVSLFAPSQAKPEAQLAISCILDSEMASIKAWIELQLVQNPAWLETDSMAINARLGKLILETKQAIGTTRYVSATLICENNRENRFSFRTDSSGGEIYSLVLELDS